MTEKFPKIRSTRRRGCAGVARWGVYLSTVALLGLFVIAIWFPHGYISKATAAKTSGERVLTIRLENGRFAIGAIPSDLAFRGFEDIPQINGGPLPSKSREIRLAHALNGKWLSPPTLKQLSLNGSSMIHAELPLSYPLFPFALCSTIMLTRSVKRYLHRKDGCCQHCGYPLTNLPTPTCPECGTSTNA